MLLIRTILFYANLILTTILGGLTVVIIGFFQRFSDFSYYRVMLPWMNNVLFFGGVKVILQGVENIAGRGPFIVVGNHQSHVDIPAVMGHLPLKMTVIAKKELFRIPFFGQAMRAFGILSIDRSNRRKSIETLNQAAAILKEQELSVLAFPEGTRSENGEISPFKKGPFMLAINSGIPILPVSIKGTYAILPKGQL
nr:lysophospholipid acyltransferase family protein [Calditrichia bacterium]